MKATIKWKSLVVERTVDRGDVKGRTAWGEWGWTIVWSTEKINTIPPWPWSAANANGMMGRNNKPTGGGHGEEEDGDSKRMGGGAMDYQFITSVIERLKEDTWHIVSDWKFLLGNVMEPNNQPKGGRHEREEDGEGTWMWGGVRGYQYAASVIERGRRQLGTSSTIEHSCLAMTLSAMALIQKHRPPKLQGSWIIYSLIA